MNNPASSSNGYLAYYVDGNKIFEIDNLKIRNSNSNRIPDQLFFSTFFGGSTPDFAAECDPECYTYYKNIRIYT